MPKKKEPAKAPRPASAPKRHKAPKDRARLSRREVQDLGDAIAEMRPPTMSREHLAGLRELLALQAPNETALRQAANAVRLLSGVEAANSALDTLRVVVPRSTAQTAWVAAGMPDALRHTQGLSTVALDTNVLLDAFRRLDVSAGLRSLNMEVITGLRPAQLNATALAAQRFMAGITGQPIQGKFTLDAVVAAPSGADEGAPAQASSVSSADVLAALKEINDTMVSEGQANRAQGDALAADSAEQTRLIFLATIIVAVVLADQQLWNGWSVALLRALAELLAGR